MRTLKDDNVSFSEAFLTFGLLGLMILLVGAGIYGVLIRGNPDMITKNIRPIKGWDGYLSRESACLSVCTQAGRDNTPYLFLNATYDPSIEICACYLSKVNVSGFLYVGSVENQSSWMFELPNLSTVKN